MTRRTPSIFFFIFAIMSCCYIPQYAQLKDGDILFRGNNKSGISKAINEVTQTSKKNNYTHMGICQVTDNTVYVIHACAQKGVCKEKLEDFCKPNGDTIYTTDAFRLEEKYIHSIIPALKRANYLINQPYDNTYILDNPGYYCSEFIYHIFSNDSIFTLNPMTFINPETNEFHRGWIKHYKELGIQIPEGQPGCNPNEMATEKKVYFLFKVQ